MSRGLCLGWLQFLYFDLRQQTTVTPYDNWAQMKERVRNESSRYKEHERGKGQRTERKSMFELSHMCMLEALLVTMWMWSTAFAEQGRWWTCFLFGGKLKFHCNISKSPCGVCISRSNLLSVNSRGNHLNQILLSFFQQIQSRFDWGLK